MIETLSSYERQILDWLAGAQASMLCGSCRRQGRCDVATMVPPAPTPALTALWLFR